jgi:hypothetical protein
MPGQALKAEAENPGSGLRNPKTPWDVYMTMHHFPRLVRANGRLFPETTVMFWALLDSQLGVRNAKPAQVFTLPRDGYQAFINIPLKTLAYSRSRPS